MLKNNSGNASTGLLIALVIAIVAVGFGAYTLLNQSNKSTDMAANSPPPTFTPIPMPTDVTQPTSVPNNPASVDTSNTALDQDLQQISTKVNAAASASGQVDTSIQNQSADTVTIQ